MILCNMGSIGYRISELIKSKNLNAKGFAIIIGVQPSKVSGWINNKFSPNIDSILSIHNKFNKLNLTWLLLGIGKMFNEDSVNLQLEANEEITNYQINNHKNEQNWYGLISSQQRTIEKLTDLLSNDKKRNIADGA